MSIISSELLSSHIEKLARLLTETEAAEVLSCSQKVMKKWRYLAGGPPCLDQFGPGKPNFGDPYGPYVNP